MRDLGSPGIFRSQRLFENWEKQLISHLLLKRIRNKESLKHSHFLNILACMLHLMVPHHRRTCSMHYENSETSPQMTNSIHPQIFLIINPKEVAINSVQWGWTVWTCWNTPNRSRTRISRCGAGTKVVCKNSMTSLEQHWPWVDAAQSWSRMQKNP